MSTDIETKHVRKLINAPDVPYTATRDRDFYRAFAKAHGVSYGGTWGGYLQFEKEIIKPERPVPGQPGTFYVRQALYGLTSCTDEDIDSGNAAWMIEHGYTRTGDPLETDG